MDLVDTLPDVRYWSKILCRSIPASSLTLRWKSQTWNFSWLLKCLYHISQSSESIHLSNIRTLEGCLFHSITTDPRVHALGWGWRSKFRTSSYSSDFEFFLFFFPSNAFGFFGKAQFRRAMLSCDSSNFLLPLLKHFGCYGNLKVSINLQLEKWKLRFIAHCRYFDKSFTEMFVELSSMKHNILVETSQFDWLPWQRKG